MSDRRFHERVRACRPDEDLKPSRYWVAVLRLGRDPDGQLTQEDFLWIKANAKITVGKVLETYLAKYQSDVVLKLNGTFPDHSSRMADLVSVEPDESGPRIVAFQAVDADSLDSAGSMSVPVTPSAPTAPLGARPESLATDVSMGTSHSRTPSLAKPEPGNSPMLANGGLTSPRAHQVFRPAANRPKQNTPPMVFGALPPSSVSGTRSYTPLAGAPTATRTGFHQNPYTASYQSSTPSMGAHSSAKSVKTDLVERGTPQAPSYGAEQPSEPAAPPLRPLDKKFAADAFPRDDDPSSQAERTNTEPLPQEVVHEHEQTFLQKLLNEKDPELLEAGMQTGLELVEKLRAPLVKHSDESQDARTWDQSLGELQKLAVRTRTIVGVVGNTGAGKSSVINAMLDEERLVPTNCMRACTAVVTELSYNDSEDEDAKYIAEIEFIKPEDWEKELNLLFQDLGDGGDTSSDDAGIALAKIKAVYPHMNRDMMREIAHKGTESLMEETRAKNLLGTLKTIKERSPERFYARLQTFVDSQDKSTADKRKEPKKMEYWPLIKVVKIYTKSPALSTGAVIVDLPGVQDSNAARAAVAESYMKQCTGLWIVAPITRAVDDKAAKRLLGDSFKRQLKYDGTYSAVTFICSKTDDISPTEALPTLGLAEEGESYEEESERIQKEIKSLQDQAKECRETKAAYRKNIEDADEQIEQWEVLKDKLEDGETVYEPSEKTEKPKKRKRESNKEQGGGKKRRGNDSDDDFIDDVMEISDAGSDVERASSHGEEDEPADEPEERTPLTAENIDTKLKELRQRKKDTRWEIRVIEDKVREIVARIKELKEKGFEIETIVTAMCVQKRNELSKGAIQLDFASGIKELDQEAAQDEDEDNFDPEQDIRDYGEVARSLPVFCISSRAYQKLCGRFRRDKAVPGYSSLEETEIPQLQAHCKKLTEAGRAAACRKFLNSLAQLLTSMGLWSSNDGTGVKMSDHEKKTEAAFLQKELAKVERGLDGVVDECLADMTNALTENIYEKYDDLIQKAADASVQTAAGWGAHKNDGGLMWATYKATVRRNGVYTGAAGPRDFNGELMEPIIKNLSTGWERAFQRRVPAQIKTFTKKTCKLLNDFDSVVQKRAQDTGASLAGLAALKRQLDGYEPFLNGHATAIVEKMNAMQREANREFTPAIATAMSHAYAWCTEERGQGQFKRMKEHMQDHVEANRTSMFKTACDGVKANLNAMCRAIKEQMSERASEIYYTLHRDYTMVLGGVQYADAALMPRVERAIRSDVADILVDADDMFRLEDDNGQQEDGQQENGQQEDGQQENGQQEDGQQEDGQQEDGHEENGQQENEQQENEQQESGKQESGQQDHDMDGHTPINGADEDHESHQSDENTMVEDDDQHVDSSGKTAVPDGVREDTAVSDVA